MTERNRDGEARDDILDAVIESSAIQPQDSTPSNGTYVCATCNGDGTALTRLLGLAAVVGLCVLTLTLSGCGSREHGASKKSAPAPTPSLLTTGSDPDDIKLTARDVKGTSVARSGKSWDVTMTLSKSAADQFSRLTRAVARRGASEGISQSVVVRLNGKVSAKILVDFRKWPSGMYGNDSVVTSYSTEHEARDFARSVNADR